MENYKKRLEVGDNVIRRDGISNMQVMLNVVRVTKTQAILNDGCKLKIEYYGLHLDKVGSNLWDCTSYELATEKSINEYNIYARELKLKRWFDNFYKKASIEQIEKIYNEYKDKQLWK